MREYIERMEKISTELENNFFSIANLPFTIRLQIMNLKIFNGNFPRIFIDGLYTTLGIMECENINQTIKNDYKNLILELKQHMIKED